MRVRMVSTRGRQWPNTWCWIPSMVKVATWEGSLIMGSKNPSRVRKVSMCVGRGSSSYDPAQGVRLWVGEGIYMHSQGGVLRETCALLYERSIPTEKKSSMKKIKDSLTYGVGLELEPITLAARGKPCWSFFSGHFYKAVLSCSPIAPYTHLSRAKALEEGSRTTQ